jgi:hypothetical protein
VPLPPLSVAATLSCRARRSSQFEAYLGFRVATADGLGDALDPAYRTTIVPILGVGQGVGRHILEMWGRATASDARGRLGKDDVQVTNQSDKIMLLPKLDVMGALVRAVVLSGGNEGFLREGSRTSGRTLSEELDLHDRSLAA